MEQVHGQGVGLGRVDLEGQGVVGHRGHIVVVHPRHAGQPHAGVAAVLIRTQAVGKAAGGVVEGYPTGAHQHDVAGLHFDATHGRCLVEVVAGDGVWAVQDFDTLCAGYVQQHSARHHAA